MNKLLLTTAVAAILCAGVAATAEANDRSLKATMIHASDCQVETGFTARLAQGTWNVQSPGATAGLASIECPLPINNIEMGATGTDNDLTSFRVHYQDPDGVGLQGTITVTLYKTTAVPRTTTAVCGATLSPTSTSYTTTSVPCVHDVAAGGAFYYFNLTMYAQPNSTGTVGFLGIDFP